MVCWQQWSDLSLAVCPWHGLSASIFSSPREAAVSGAFTIDSRGVSHSSFQTWYIHSIFMDENSEDHTGKQLAQSHIAVKWQRWDLNSGLSMGAHLGLQASGQLMQEAPLKTGPPVPIDRCPQCPSCTGSGAEEIWSLPGGARSQVGQMKQKMGPGGWG